MEYLATFQASSNAQMIDRFLRSRGIKNETVLSAMAKIPRQHFVPDSFRSHAYSDTPLPIGFEQTISQPYIVGLMTQELIKNGGQRFLEIGTGSGYQTAVLAELVKTVFSIERVMSFVPLARRRLEELGYHNVSIKGGNGAHGWKEFAPFDGIIVTAAIKDLPMLLVDQLVEGGTMVTPVEDKDGNQLLYSMRKVKGNLQKRVMGPCKFVPFIHPS